MQSPPFPLYLVLPGSKYSPQHHVLKHLSTAYKFRNYQSPIISTTYLSPPSPLFFYSYTEVKLLRYFYPHNFRIRAATCEFFSYTSLVFTRCHHWLLPFHSKIHFNIILWMKLSFPSQYCTPTYVNNSLHVRRLKFWIKLSLAPCVLQFSPTISSSISRPYL